MGFLYPTCTTWAISLCYKGFRYQTLIFFLVILWTLLCYVFFDNRNSIHNLSIMICVARYDHSWSTTGDNVTHNVIDHCFDEHNVVDHSVASIVDFTVIDHSDIMPQLQRNQCCSSKTETVRQGFLSLLLWTRAFIDLVAAIFH